MKSEVQIPTKTKNNRWFLLPSVLAWWIEVPGAYCCWEVTDMKKYIYAFSRIQMILWIYSTLFPSWKQINHLFWSRSYLQQSKYHNHKVQLLIINTATVNLSIKRNIRTTNHIHAPNAIKIEIRTNAIHKIESILTFLCLALSSFVTLAFSFIVPVAGVTGIGEDIGKLSPI